MCLTVPASRNRDDHIKKQDEQWEHRRLDTEWQYLGRDSGLKVDIGRHKHLEEEDWIESTAVDERPREEPDNAQRPAL